MKYEKRTLKRYEVATGFNNDCNYEISRDTEEDLYRNIVDCAQKEHDLRSEDLTPRLEEQIRSLIDIAGNHRLVDSDLDPVFIKIMSRRGLVGPIIYLIAIGISFISIQISLIFYIAIPLYYLVPARKGKSWFW